MKTKNLLGIFFLFLCTITLVSCGDDEKQEIYSLSFEKGYYERPLLGAKNIPVRGGNRDYTVTVQNTDVLSINIDLCLKHLYFEQLRYSLCSKYRCFKHKY